MTNGFGVPTDQMEILKKSVTAGDYQKDPQSFVAHWVIPNYMSGDRDLPIFGAPGRDWVLSSTLYRESMWADAVSIAISKIAARGFDVDSDIPLRAKRAQDLFLNFDSGKGYVSGLQKHLQNFLLTSNGAHVEIVRATRALGSRIIGLVPLDTFRVRRTGDPDYPVIYRDRMGREHIMREWDVFSLADMPDPADTWYGLGHPAAERAYKAIMKLEAIERYILDKVSGQRILAFHIVGGVTPKNLEDAKLTAQGEAQAKGVTNYMGAAIVAMMGDTPASLVTIPLAELPDGFQRKEEWDIAITTYARALGIAVQDLQPLSGQGLGTGTQSVVLDEAAKGQGLAVWSQQWEHAVNQYALDERTTYAIKTHDIRDREREAKVSIDLASVAVMLLQVGLTPAQIINLLVDWNQLPPEYRIENIDLTPGDQLSDDEKPEQIEAETADETPQPESPEVPTGTVTKNPAKLQVSQVPGSPSAAPTPVAPNDELAETADIQQVALNGAQVASALEILAKVSASELTYEQGLNALQIFFGLTIEQADQLLVKAGSGQVKVPEVVAPAIAGQKPIGSVTPPMSESSVKELMNAIERASNVVRTHTELQTESEKAMRRSDEIGIVEALKQLSEVASQPAPIMPTPIVNIPAPIVNVPAPIVNVAAPQVKVMPTPVIVNNDATVKAIGLLSDRVEKLATEQSRGRRLKVTKRDSDGKVSEWEER